MKTYKSLYGLMRSFQDLVQAFQIPFKDLLEAFKELLKAFKRHSQDLLKGLLKAFYSPSKHL